MNGKRDRKKVEDLLEQLGERDLPLTGPEATTPELIETLSRFPRSRMLYVVDQAGHLLGALTLGSLVRHHYAPSQDAGLLGRGTLRLLTTETAEDMMLRHPLSAELDQDLGSLARQMVRHNVKEVPVLDRQGKVVGDLTILDLLKQRLG